MTKSQWEHIWKALDKDIDNRTALGDAWAQIHPVVKETIKSDWRKIFEDVGGK